MPPWMSRDECEDVPPPKSPLSTRAVRKPRNAASRAIPAPVIPPPMTSTSTGSAAIDSSAATRVRNENGVSSDNSRPSGGRGRFRAWYVLRGECNAAEKRTARGGCRGLPHAVLQVGDVAQGRPGGGPRPVRDARAARAHEPGRRRGRRRHLRTGCAVGARPQRRPRSEPAPAVPQRDPGLLLEPRLRVVRPGGRQRLRRDRPGRRGRRARRRRGIAVRHPDPRVAPPRRYPRGGEQSQDARRPAPSAERSEEHTSELQSQSNLVCRLLLEKKKQ